MAGRGARAKRQEMRKGYMAAVLAGEKPTEAQETLVRLKGRIMAIERGVKALPGLRTMVVKLEELTKGAV